MHLNFLEGSTRNTGGDFWGLVAEERDKKQEVHFSSNTPLCLSKNLFILLLPRFLVCKLRDTDVPLTTCTCQSVEWGPEGQLMVFIRFGG